MLTIGQLASYAGVTVRTVRHYHQIGLLPEPERDHSGYRSYDTAAVVRLIRIRVLAEAGVPLARVQQLLLAGPDEFAQAVQEIDEGLRADIRRLQRNRELIAKLAAGDHLTLPQTVPDYLDRLRRLGVGEAYIELERDAWVMLAAQDPGSIGPVIAEKNRHLDEDPDMTRLYRLLSSAPGWAPHDPRVVELADLVEHLRIRALQRGELEISSTHQADPVTTLLDAAMTESAPVARQLLTILEQRGWRGWNRIERIPEDRIRRDD
ncbi:MerR family transcriptional regulator [Microbacterium sp. BK668]|uniref:MerR family transcriptional regulator n=1 Tax=Microbacterium sp. BK668 TaxID=2512118 RepID=UPI00106126DE|nr:MerR family transcriptional regulator [Microbacterium sp. BK668]TDN92801.1 DNA-binding transcriptional MerR regulator [Microbacterium sp. BK668]